MSKPVEGFDWTVSLDVNTHLEMNWVNPGTFIMGSPEGELGRNSNEKQHKVELTKGFWLGKYEVTQAQYEAVIDINPSAKDRGIGANYPVNMVTYDDALAFCDKLTEKERLVGRLSNEYKYTLPTEAQWEYACRAGTTTAMYNGDSTEANLNEVGWYGNSNGGGGNAGGKSHPVGKKKPNAWGFYDMLGNGWEWCLGWYGEYPVTSETDPMGASMGTDRILRGGSWWDSFGTHHRCAYRAHIVHGHTDALDGFRLALVQCNNDK